MIQLLCDETATTLSAAEQEVIAAAAAALLPESLTFQVDVSFVSNEDIAALNQKYRNKAEATDVLSFPCIDAHTLDQQPAVPLLLGSIVIAPEYAAAAGTPLTELLAHGLIHLAGFDHETDRPAWDAAETLVLSETAKHNLELVGLQYAQPLADTEYL
jgi:probable rRNA maturation factor